jgi:hypothetical protein
MSRKPARKRPCRICRRWFLPDTRLKDRQMTCGDAQCKRQWHCKKCTEWNRKNLDYFRSNYLQKKLDAVGASAVSSKPFDKQMGQPRSRFRSGLPLAYVQEVIGVQHLIIIEYLTQLLHRRFQEAFNRQATVNTRQMRQLPPMVCSRRDGL